MQTTENGVCTVLVVQEGSIPSPCVGWRPTAGWLPGSQRVATERQVEPMPTDWKFHAEGAGSVVSTNSGVDGRVKTMTVELDAFRYRQWTEDEDDIRSMGRDPEHMHYDEETDAFEEFADGAHASFEFDVTDGAAELAAVTPEDVDSLEPRHMMLFPAAERVVEAQPTIDYCNATLHTLSSWYDGAEDVHVEKLDN